MSEPRRHDEPERLSYEEVAELQEGLSVVGPWVYLSGAGGVVRAERAGTHRHEQAALTADGLLQAVEECEKRLQEREDTTGVRTGLIVG